MTFKTPTRLKSTNADTQFIPLFKSTMCVSKLSKYSQTVGQNDSQLYKNVFILYKILDEILKTITKTLLGLLWQARSQK